MGRGGSRAPVALLRAASLEALDRTFFHLPLSTQRTVRLENTADNLPDADHGRASSVTPMLLRSADG